MSDFSQLATDDIITKTISALKANGVESSVVENSQEAKQKVLDLLPKGAEVIAMSSETLIQTGIRQEIDEPGNYQSVRKKLMSMNRETQNREMNKLGAAPEFAVGSVHAVTQDGKIIVASNTGSQLPAYVYGAEHVIWVVGTQKIVANLDEGLKRIYDYVLPLESVRLNKAYNLTTGSFVSKLLIINKEVKPGRITLIFVKEKLGF